MAADMAKGEGKKIKGKIRSGYGRLTGSPGQRIKGKKEQIQGSLRQKKGKVKYKI